jgi:uncharacterized protein with von Willebrand factor type A (vWA) domain
MGRHRLTPDVADVVARFADRLHLAGIAVTPERAGRLASALDIAAPSTTAELYWLARVTVAGDRHELATFDAVFAEVFRGFVDVADSRGAAEQPRLPPAIERSERRGDPVNDVTEADGGPPRPRVLGEDRDGPGGDEQPAPVGAPASEHAVLRQRDFGSCTPDELAQLRRLMSRMRVVTPQRPSRRRRRHARGDSIDLRASIRRARRTGGDPATLVRRRVTERRRRVVLLADVSGSMEAYSRAYLYLLHGAVRALRADTFVFSTRLTRLTRTLALHDPERALATAMAATDDWSGGTRIGSALKEFNDRWGRRGLARGAVVVIVSDGWESGDTSELGRQMDRLSRLAHRIVWVNPRSQRPGYEPLVGGMTAALPHVDAFVSGHSVEALEHVLDVIATDVSTRRRGMR